MAWEVLITSLRNFGDRSGELDSVRLHSVNKQIPNLMSLVTCHLPPPSSIITQVEFRDFGYMQKKTEAKTETVKVAVGIAKWWQLYTEAKVL